MVVDDGLNALAPRVVSAAMGMRFIPFSVSGGRSTRAPSTGWPLFLQPDQLFVRPVRHSLRLLKIRILPEDSPLMKMAF